MRDGGEGQGRGELSPTRSSPDPHSSCSRSPLPFGWESRRASEGLLGGAGIAGIYLTVVVGEVTSEL